jgi:hypothetical protein
LASFLVDVEIAGVGWIPFIDAEFVGIINPI